MEMRGAALILVPRQARDQESQHEGFGEHLVSGSPLDLVQSLSKGEGNLHSCRTLLRKEPA